MSAATSTSSSTCCLIASTSGPVATPSATSRLENVGMGSRFDSSSRSLGGLYSTSSSESEWEYGRMTWACTSAGPRRCRQCATARVSASKDAIGSQPSTSSMKRSGKLATSFETEAPAVCTSTGTEIAYLLSSIDRKSTRLNSSHSQISYAVFCLKKKKEVFRADRKSTRLNSSHSQISDVVFCLKEK